MSPITIAVMRSSHRWKGGFITVECVTSLGNIYGHRNGASDYGRRRKFSNPLFFTPNGLINSYPESEKDFFTSYEVAETMLRQLADVGKYGAWEIRDTTLAKEHSSKRYLRWLNVAKDKEYREPRLTLEEQASVFESGGREALLKIYSKSHTSHVIVKLRSNFADRLKEQLAADAVKQQEALERFTTKLNR